jgi:hypothetical protein
MSSDVAGGLAGCQVRFEVAVGDFERFLMVGKGASAATQQCYVRHVQAMLAELCDATGTIDLGRVSAAWVRSYGPPRAFRIATIRVVRLLAVDSGTRCRPRVGYGSPAPSEVAWYYSGTRCSGPHRCGRVPSSGRRCG